MVPTRLPDVFSRLAGAVTAALVVIITAGSLPPTGNPAHARTDPGAAEILWDEWGTPHIFAEDTEGLFRAFGWAQMHSHGDLLLRMLAQARGVAAEYGGDRYRISDRATRIMSLPEQGAAWYAAQSVSFQRDVDAFASGINDYASAHPDALAATFKPVLPVDGSDVMAHVARVMFIFLANSSDCPSVLPVGSILDAGSLGSNGWAIAPSRSASGASMLLANPHLAWGGEQTFYEAQLVGPGYDLYGGTNVGFPVITMGFNDHLGWAHTVGTLDACDVYRLTPADGGYVMDGAIRQFETDTQTLRVRQADGSVTEEPLTVRRSVHGPVVEHDGGLYAIRIASVGQTSTVGLLEQWWDMGAADDLMEFRAILERNQLPMFNVIYADRDGHVYAAFAGQVPRRPTAFDGSWSGVIPGDTVDTLWTDVHAFEELPQVVDPPSGYVQNSNSPPWSFTFPRPSHLDPDGYPAYMAPRTLGWRERRGIRMIEESPGMTLDGMVRLKHSTRMELADRLLPELIAAARESEDVAARAAAEVLAAWDRMADPDSRGTMLFFSWVLALGPLDEATIAALFSTPEDLSDPLGTPAGLADPTAAVAALAAAAGQVEAAFGRLDVPWGEVARLQRGTVDLPANGFLGDPFGVFRVLVPDPAELFAGRPGPVVAGDSFIAAVEFSTPLRARVLMTYGNASQPASPHRGDQLVLAARGELRPAWRTRDEIEAHLEERTVVPPS